jgi:anti-sigma factor ChrR (cupin superfamily)
MSEVFRCEDKDTLVAYLYGEVDADVRREVERHLRTCAACTRETEGLQSVRQDLQLWMPPEAEFGFSIVQNGTPRPAPVLTSSRWASMRALPAWAQVAAAALFIAAAAAIANVQVRTTSDGVVVSTGWMPHAEPVTASVTAPSNDEWRTQFVALEQNLRNELRQELRNEITAQQVAIRDALAAPATSSDASGVIRRVQNMIEASEERQRQEMALRFAQAERMWNVRWTNDRATLNRTLGNLQGRTMAVQAGQQELRNGIIRLQRVSAPQPNQ